MILKLLKILLLFIKELRAGQHCQPPSVANGKTNCPDEIIPGATCSVICDSGYIATPGKERANCQSELCLNTKMSHAASGST